MTATYEPAAPPCSMNFRESTKATRAAYYKWYWEQVPLRLEILRAIVNESSGYEDWAMDFTPNSLIALGEWFAAHVTTEERTAEQIEAIRARQRFEMEVQTWDLTYQTVAYAFDLGIYVGQVLQRNNAQLEWGQDLSRKDSAYFGRAVVKGFKGGVWFEPYHMMGVLAYGIAKGTKSGKRLYELYEIWVKNIA